MCGQTDGYLNVGRNHYFVCDTHRTKWYVGFNVFSVHEGPEQWDINSKLLDTYAKVKPVKEWPIRKEKKVRAVTVSAQKRWYWPRRLSSITNRTTPPRFPTKFRTAPMLTHDAHQTSDPYVTIWGSLLHHVPPSPGIKMDDINRFNDVMQSADWMREWAPVDIEDHHSDPHHCTSCFVGHDTRDMMYQAHRLWLVTAAAMAEQPVSGEPDFDPGLNVLVAALDDRFQGSVDLVRVRPDTDKDALLVQHFFTRESGCWVLYPPFYWTKAGPSTYQDENATETQQRLVRQSCERTLRLVTTVCTVGKALKARIEAENPF